MNKHKTTSNKTISTLLLDDILKTLYRKVDKPTYFITKITSAANLDSVATLEKIGGENGFVFYKRK